MVVVEIWYFHVSERNRVVYDRAQFHVPVLSCNFALSYITLYHKMYRIFKISYVHKKKLKSYILGI